MRGNDNYFPKREFPVHSSSADCIVIECKIRSTQPLLSFSVFRTNYTCASFNLFPLVRNHHRVVEWIRRVSKKKHDTRRNEFKTTRVRYAFREGLNLFTERR